MQPMEGISVIVPAKNEAAVVPACLGSLLDQTYDGPLQVVVVANNCTDDTVAVARSFSERFAQRGWQLEVLDMEMDSGAQGTKPGALNGGDAAAIHADRIYLDADIQVSAHALRAIADAFRTGVLLCAPSIVASGTCYASRAYARIWSSLPLVRRDVIGAGVYAVSGHGRKRWDVFPDIVSDDKFVRLHFQPGERVVLKDAEFEIRMPAGLRELVIVRSRWIRGNWELAETFPHLAVTDQRRWRDSVRHLASTPSCWRDVPLVAAIYACAEFRALLTRRTGTLRWERAERARALRA